MFFGFDWQVFSIIAYLEDFFSPVNLFWTPPLWRGFRYTKTGRGESLSLKFRSPPLPNGCRQGDFSPAHHENSGDIDRMDVEEWKSARWIRPPEGQRPTPNSRSLFLLRANRFHALHLDFFDKHPFHCSCNHALRKLRFARWYREYQRIFPPPEISIKFSLHGIIIACYQKYNLSSTQNQ